MPESDAELSPAQLEVMNVVWERGEAGVSDVWEALRRRRRLARNTVQTTLSRLHARGWLRVRNREGAFIYAAARPRKRTIGRMVARLIDNAFGGSASGLVLSLLEEGHLSKAEAARIRELIDATEGRRGP